MKNIYSTICPNCKKEQELLQVAGKLIKSVKKPKMLFECDNCAFTSAVIFDGIDIFYKRSEVKENRNYV